MSKRKRHVNQDIPGQRDNLDTVLQSNEFKDYICSKAYDIISEGLL
jgi:hypothetical protein